MRSLAFVLVTLDLHDWNDVKTRTCTARGRLASMKLMAQTVVTSRLASCGEVDDDADDDDEDDRQHDEQHAVLNDSEDK